MTPAEEGAARHGGRPYKQQQARSVAALAGPEVPAPFERFRIARGQHRIVLPIGEIFREPPALKKMLEARSHNAVAQLRVARAVELRKHLFDGLERPQIHRIVRGKSEEPVVQAAGSLETVRGEFSGPVLPQGPAKER